jgi:hypothetical protein
MAINWDEIEDNLKSPEQRKAELEKWRLDQEAGNRRILREWATRFEGDLAKLSRVFGAKWGTRVTLASGPFTKVIVDDDSLSLGLRLAPDGLSISFLVNGAEQVVGYAPNLSRWTLRDDSSHQGINVPDHFDSLFNSFVKQVKARLPL